MKAMGTHQGASNSPIVFAPSGASRRAVVLLICRIDLFVMNVAESKSRDTLPGKIDGV